MTPKYHAVAHQLRKLLYRCRPEGGHFFRRSGEGQEQGGITSLGIMLSDLESALL